MLVPRVILFRPEHDPRILVRKVDFVERAGLEPARGLPPRRPGGVDHRTLPVRLGQGEAPLPPAQRPSRANAEGVRAATGFDYDAPEIVPTTIEPDAATRDLIRTVIREDIAESYSRFAAEYRG